MKTSKGLFDETVLQCIYAGIWSKEKTTTVKKSIKELFYDSIQELHLSMKIKIHLTVIGMYKQTCVTNEIVIKSYKDKLANFAVAQTSIGNRLEDFMTTGMFSKRLRAFMNRLKF